MMDNYLTWFGVSFVVCLILTPLFAKIANLIGVIDHPSQRRFHLTSMPLLGGVAIAATVLGVTYFADQSGMVVTRRVASILAAGTFLMILGLLDDVKSISPIVKLTGQAIAATIMVAGGLHVCVTGIAIIDYPITYVWVIGITNCQNLLDNIDGLSGGSAAIAACFFAIIGFMTGNAALAVLAVVFSGASLGFLFHNFHPASIFSGDAGSMFLGAILAGLGLMVVQPLDVVSHFVPPLILGLLIFDTGLVTINRLARGYKITDGGKDHTSHRLCNLGFSIQGAVIFIFSVCFAFGFAAVLITQVAADKAMLIPLMLFFVAATCWFLLKNAYDYKDHPVARG